VKRIVGVIIAY